MNAAERTHYDINEGVMVQFEMYDEGQAAQQVCLYPSLFDSLLTSSQAFRNHPEFKMQCMANMGSKSTTQSDPQYRSYLDTYDVDKRSVFVGNLAIDVTESELFEIFQPFGRIVQVTLHKNDSTLDGKSPNPLSPSSYCSILTRTSQHKTLLRLR